MRRLGALLTFVAITALSMPADAQEQPPIDTIVIVMQEDRTYDNYFGTYPGANGWPEGFTMAVDPFDLAAGAVAPFKLDSTRTPSLPHSAKAMVRAFNKGSMDGFIDSAEAYGATDPALTMGYYDYRDIPFYWHLADEYVLADNWFSSVMGPSFPNHLYLFAATMTGPNGERYTSVPAEGLDVVTIFDRLEEAGVSWKVYVQGYDPTANFRSTEARLGLTDTAAQLIWVPLVGIPRFIDDPVLNSKIVDLSEFFVDAANSELPSVAMITPSGLSEHPPGDLKLGHFFAVDLLEALMVSDQWDRSAFILTWDEWGGWADHVAPPQVDEDGYGMRVPGLIVSPYAKRGYVDSTLYDHTSVLATIEWLFDVDPLTPRDANAAPFENAFDFTQPPRAPVFPAPEYLPEEETPPELPLEELNGVYALVFGSLVVVAGAEWGRSRLRGKSNKRSTGDPEDYS